MVSNVERLKMENRHNLPIEIRNDQLAQATVLKYKVSILQDAQVTLK